MSIEFFDLLADEGWELRSPDPTSPAHRWSEGGTLADAPIDLAATFDGARLVATGIDATFGLTGIRLRPGSTVPLHHHDQQVLRIVFGGSFEVRTDGPETDVVTVAGGQFCTIEAGVVHSLTAGPDGVTYTESWHLGVTDPVTTWHPDAAWTRR